MKSSTINTIIPYVILCLVSLIVIIIHHDKTKPDLRKHLYDYYDKDSIHYIIYERNDTIYHEEYVSGKLISRIKTQLK